jgi:hypothetical protein
MKYFKLICTGNGKSEVTQQCSSKIMYNCYLTYVIQNHVDFVVPHLWVGGQYSIASILTCYQQDGPEIEHQWEREFSHLFRPPVGPT